MAFRLNGMFEDSDSFRDRRRPDAVWRDADGDDCAERTNNDRTRYEYLHDTRIADRGIHLISRAAG